MPEIIFCKECKYFKPYAEESAKGYGECQCGHTKNNYGFKYSDFCSNAIKRAEIPSAYMEDKANKNC